MLSVLTERDGMARPIKQLVIDGKTIVGLSKIAKNRWRISQTGERFTEADQYKALAYFKSKVKGRDSVFIPIAKGTNVDLIAVKRIPRAATLWPQTVKALQGIKRRGQSPYVFTSTHGTRY